MKVFVFKATPDSPRMFESDFIDAFSRTHPVIVPVLFVPLIGICAGYSLYAGVDLLTVGALFVGGLAAWTLAEYWLHRTLFHWVPPGKLGARIHFIAHGVHHQWPKDRYRLVMPPAISLSLFVLFLAAWWLVFGGRWAPAWHAGFVFGYMLYDLAHYYIHHFHPKSAWLLQLKKNHMLHHFQDSEARFGVSSTFWDRVFGTRGKTAS